MDFTKKIKVPIGGFPNLNYGNFNFFFLVNSTALHQKHLGMYITFIYPIHLWNSKNVKIVLFVFSVLELNSSISYQVCKYYSSYYNLSKNLSIFTIFFIRQKNLALFLYKFWHFLKYIYIYFTFDQVYHRSGYSMNRLHWFVIASHWTG